MRGHQQQRYRVVDRIAAGGMAEVFRAESAGLEGFKKKVAIKRVLPHLSEKKSFISMFLDEARLCAHLSHSNCVQVFDVGVGENSYFIVMEFVDGADLKRVLEWLKKNNKKFPIQYAVHICAKICEGLSYAHELADESGTPLTIVHRDLSPPNVLITKFGEIKIVDFGLAKANTQLEKSDPGIIKGKFSYLSPEAAKGMHVDLRTDLFAVGIILWEMLAGRKLFQGNTDIETVRMVQKAEIPSLSEMNPEVDAELQQIIFKGLAGDPDKRYQTAREFGSALTSWLFTSQSPVNSYEIADMVQGVMRDFAKEKKTSSVATIDRLIEDTLFEFNSLDEAAGGGAPGAFKGVTGNKRGLEIKDVNFEKVDDWFDDDANPSAPAIPAISAVPPPTESMAVATALVEGTRPAPKSQPPPASAAEPAVASSASPASAAGSNAAKTATPEPPPASTSPASASPASTGASAITTTAPKPPPAMKISKATEEAVVLPESKPPYVIIVVAVVVIGVIIAVLAGAFN